MWFGAGKQEEDAAQLKLGDDFDESKSLVHSLWNSEVIVILEAEIERMKQQEPDEQVPQ